ncbi:MAG TPA: sugar porter family MFS transporter [Isosphaeraceae bacterium]|nr:sugar porter family MFS transporter [Isosphaeraceae bacterium]
MKARIYLWSLTSALAGFLFGFDTVVISGAEQTIQSLWHLSAGMHGFAIGSALYGTVVGALVGGWPTDRFGRKATLTAIGILYVISAVGCAYSWNVYSFILARFIGGVGIGVSTVAAPLYISEISPPAYRGRLAGMFQFNIVFGIIVAFLSNYLLRDVGVNAWRWMLGVAAFPSLVYTVSCLGLPESPRWLIGRRRDREAGLRVMRLIMADEPSDKVEKAADEIMAASSEQVEVGPFWTRQLRRPIMLAILIAFFNQLSGINAVLYFAPRIFELTGLGAKAALLQSVGIGITNLLFTFAGLRLIDRIGRRTLLYVGSFGYILSLGLTSWAFFTGHFAIVPACIFAFIAAHAIGQGTVIWVFISEIFPNRHRATGQALGSLTHWVFAALLTTFFPSMVAAFAPGYVFLFFCGMMVLQLGWVRLMVPETKGISLEEIEHRLAGNPGAASAG